MNSYYELDGYLEKLKLITMNSRDHQHEFECIEARDLIFELFRYSTKIINIPKLDTDLKFNESIDWKEIIALLNKLEAPLKKSKAIELSGERTIDPTEAYKKIRDFVDSAARQDLEVKWEGLLRLELFVDPHLGELFMLLHPNSSVVRATESAVEKRLNKLSEKTVVALWRRAKASFNPDPIDRLELDAKSSLIPKDFFSTTDIKKIRLYLAKYITWLRSHLLLEKYKRKEFRSYSFGFGLGKVFGVIKLMPETFDSLRKQFSVLRHLASLAVVWSDLLKESLDDVEDILGIEKSGFILSGEHFKKLGSSRAGGNRVSKLNDSELLNLFNLNAQLLILELKNLSTIEIPIVTALQHYKLGMEILIPKSRCTVETVGEVEMQKDLCKFLFEKGYLCHGVQIGNSEIDLYAKFGKKVYIIETKIFNNPPKEAQIKKAYGQLKGYIDRLYRDALGVLLIYNTSDVPLMVPDLLIRGQFVIIGVNLCSLSPSKRKNFSEIILDDKSGFRLIEHQGPQKLLSRNQIALN